MARRTRRRLRLFASCSIACPCGSRQLVFSVAASAILFGGILRSRSRRAHASVKRLMGCLRVSCCVVCGCALSALVRVRRLVLRRLVIVGAPGSPRVSCLACAWNSVGCCLVWGRCRSLGPQTLAQHASVPVGIIAHSCWAALAPLYPSEPALLALAQSRSFGAVAGQSVSLVPTGRSAFDCHTLCVLVLVGAGPGPSIPTRNILDAAPLGRGVLTSTQACNLRCKRSSICRGTPLEYVDW